MSPTPLDDANPTVLQPHNIARLEDGPPIEERVTAVGLVRHPGILAPDAERQLCAAGRRLCHLEFEGHARRSPSGRPLEGRLPTFHWVARRRLGSAVRQHGRLCVEHVRLRDIVNGKDVEAMGPTGVLDGGRPAL